MRAHPTSLITLLARVVLAVAALLAVFGPGAHGVAASAAWNAAQRPLEHLPGVRQTLPTSCGPAALATLSAWLGAPRTEAELIAEAELGPAGITLGEFARLADRIGLPGAWYRVEASDLRLVPAPFVAHLHDDADPEAGHLVAVAGVGHGYVMVADPAEGSFVTSTAAFARRFTGRVFVREERP